MKYLIWFPIFGIFKLPTSELTSWIASTVWTYLMYLIYQLFWTGMFIMLIAKLIGIE